MLLFNLNMKLMRGMEIKNPNNIMIMIMIKIKKKPQPNCHVLVRAKNTKNIVFQEKNHANIKNVVVAKKIEP